MSGSTSLVDASSGKVSVARQLTKRVASLAPSKSLFFSAVSLLLMLVATVAPSSALASWEASEGRVPHLKPPCRSAKDAFSSRTVFVWVRLPGESTPTPVDEMRETVEEMNWMIYDESLKTSEGTRALQIAVDCDASGNTAIHEYATDSTTYNSFLPFEASPELYGWPVGYGKAIKYMFFERRQKINFAAAPGTDEKSTSNRYATQTNYSRIFATEPQRHWRTPMHEFLHQNGAVSPNAPFAATSGPIGHAADDHDLMAIAAENYSVICPLKNTPLGVAERIDCNDDTYFDAKAEPGEWLAENWNMAEEENPFFIVAPKAKTDAATAVGGYKATLNGKVDPTGDASKYFFEYGPTANYGESSPLSATIGSGHGDVTVSETVTGLEPSTTYHFRVVAVKDDPSERDNSRVYGTDNTFTTGATSIPTATTLSVGAADESSATLRASIHPRGLATTYRFEYGPTTAYGSTTSVGNLAAGANPVEVTANIGSLMPGATYHYRISATNGEGTSVGKGQVFKTCPTGGCKWSLQSPPNPSPKTPSSRLNDVSCAAQTMCLAAGQDFVTSTGLLQLWDGSKWEVVKTGIGTTLSDLSCTSTTQCTAIGKDSQGARIWRLESAGGSWTASIKTPPTPEGAANAKLEDVSCTSWSACTVVGRYETEAAGTLPLIVRWNGISWSLQSAALPSEREGESTIFYGVSCSMATSCVAVGTNEPKTVSKALIERWNGTSWSIASTPEPSGATESELRGVSCSSESSCMATGTFYNGSEWAPFSERLSAGSWSVVAVPKPSGAGATFLNHVSCTSASACVTASSYSTETEGGSIEQKTLVEAWNGTSWSVQSSPNPAGQEWIELSGVSCTSPTACTAVGISRPKVLVEPAAPLALRWAGEAWSLQSPPNPTPKAPSSRLNDVSCAAQTMCLAAGQDFVTSTGLLQLWDGSKWEVVKTGLGMTLSDISCHSTDGCMAIGKDSLGVAKTWVVPSGGDWLAWATTPPTPEGASNVRLEDVSCTSSIHCTVVGRYDTAAAGTLPLVAGWNGSSWSLQSAALPSEREGESTILYGVSCSSATSCTAVGANKPKTANKPLIERWNGTSWSIATASEPAGASQSELLGVSCSSESACMATGRFNNGSESAPFAERLNAGSWSVVAMPKPSEASTSILNRVSCSSASSCVAAGSYNVSAKRLTLVEAWNGTSWSIATSPNPEGREFNELSGVSCTSPTACTAVGVSRPAVLVEPAAPLALRWE